MMFRSETKLVRRRQIFLICGILLSINSVGWRDANGQNLPPWTNVTTDPWSSAAIADSPSNPGDRALHLVVLTDDECLLPDAPELDAPESDDLRALGPRAAVIDGEIEFWCRDDLDRLYGAAWRNGQDRCPRTRSILRTGLPASLTGGEPTQLPRQCLLFLVDSQNRVLAFGVGIPSTTDWIAWLDDAVAVQQVLYHDAPFSPSTSPSHPETAQWYGRWVDRSTQRVDHFYADRLEAFATQILAFKGITEREPANFGRDQNQPFADDDSPPRQFFSNDRANADSPDFIAVDEIDSGADVLRPTATDHESNEDLRTLRAATHYFEQFYRNDFGSRFHPSASRVAAETRVWQQHWETRRSWCHCMTPWIVGSPIDLVASQLAEVVGDSSVCLPNSHRPQISDAIRSASKSSPLVLELPPARRWWSRIERAAATKSVSSNSRSPLDWNDVNERLRKIPTVAVGWSDVVYAQRMQLLPDLMLGGSYPPLDIVISHQLRPLVLRGDVPAARAIGMLKAFSGE